MELKIGSKIYNVEYNIEASLCNECIEKTIEFLLPIGSAENRDASMLYSTLYILLPIFNSIINPFHLYF